jgi:hypothetical protein
MTILAKDSYSLDGGGLRNTFLAFEPNFLISSVEVGNPRFPFSSIVEDFVIHFHQACGIFLEWLKMTLWVIGT